MISNFFSLRIRFSKFFRVAFVALKQHWTRTIQRVVDQIMYNLSAEGHKELDKKTEKALTSHSSIMNKTCPVAQVCNIDTLYTMGKKLGSGTFSEVRYAEDRRSNEQVAIKCVKKKKLGKEDVIALHVN